MHISMYSENIGMQNPTDYFDTLKNLALGAKFDFVNFYHSIHFVCHIFFLANSNTSRICCRVFVLRCCCLYSYVYIFLFFPREMNVFRVIKLHSERKRRRDENASHESDCIIDWSLTARITLKLVSNVIII